MSGELAKNKIVVTGLTVAVIIALGLELVKFSPMNILYNTHILSLQYSIACVGLSIIVSFALPVSILTYIVIFLASLGIVFTSYVYVFSTIYNTGNKLVLRLIIYTIAVALTIIYTQWLKKWKLKHDNKATV